MAIQNINRVTLLGEVYTEPTHKAAKSGKDFITFTVKTSSEPYKDRITGDTRQSYELHNVVILLEQAVKNFSMEPLYKGCEVYIEGMLKHKKWKGNNSAYGNFSDTEDEKVVAEILISNFSHKVIRLTPAGTYFPPSQNNDEDMNDLPGDGSMKDRLDDDIPF